MSKLTHQDAEGRVRMVDVGDKPVTARRAVASARVEMNAEAFAAIRDGRGPRAMRSRRPNSPASWPPSAPPSSYRSATPCPSPGETRHRAR